MITDEPTPCQNNPQPFDDVLDNPCKGTVEAAKAICAACQHRTPCLTEALAQKRVGVYGGRLLLGKTRPNWMKSAPTCAKCGDERKRRVDGRGWQGGNGMCSPCYDSEWRVAHGLPASRIGFNSRDVDSEAVLRALHGDRSVTLNLGEREAAVRVLARRGFSDRESAYTLGLTARTVLRIRSSAGIAPGMARTS